MSEIDSMTMSAIFHHLSHVRVARRWRPTVRAPDMRTPQQHLPPANRGCRIRAGRYKGERNEMAQLVTFMCKVVCAGLLCCLAMLAEESVCPHSAPDVKATLDNARKNA